MQVTASEVLSIFRRDELQLFIAGASVTVGLVAVAFSLIRKRFDPALSFFAWFAASYGIRLWMTSGIYLLMAPRTLAFAKLQMALNFLVAVPAFLFFEAAGLAGRSGRLVAYSVCLIELGLIVAGLAGAPLLLLDHINSGCVIVGSLWLLILAIRQPGSAQNSLVLRAGLLSFAGFVLWNNVVELLGHHTSIEVWGFTMFLCCLGFVAAERALQRDHQLSSLQQELEVARRIQLSILPASFPRTEHFTVAARYLPMTAVAGDFYEYLSRQHGELGLMIADVSGHGVPAALIASMVKVAIQSQQQYIAEPDRLLAGVNEALCGNTQKQFVTAAYVHLDAQSSSLRFSAAGHPPMLLLRDGEVSAIQENGLILALLPSATYTTATFPLFSGDRILLYTDGIIEAVNAREEEFGQERLSDLLKASHHKTADEVADLIQSTVKSWAQDQSDDLTLLVCDYNSPSAAQVSPNP